ncbi:MAG: hypothetical protein GY724_19280 [Actinomycetia bacterium]|nr:hypothetical protein [Actinomycetes bacterium]MCP5035487.1 hypothetical protein [Actinomycetes bacterium]
MLADEDFDDPRHPEHEAFGSCHHNDDDNENHHHGFSMVDADEMGGRLREVGLRDVEAAKRDLAGRPAITVTAGAPA